MMPKEKSGHWGSGKMPRLGSHLETGACFYLRALNKEAHECLSELGVHRCFVLHRIRTGKRSRTGRVHPPEEEEEAPVRGVKQGPQDEKKRC